MTKGMSDSHEWHAFRPSQPPLYQRVGRVTGPGKLLPLVAYWQGAVSFETAQVSTDIAAILGSARDRDGSDGHFRAELNP